MRLAKWLTALMVYFFISPIVAQADTLENGRRAACPATVSVANARLPNLSETNWERKSIIILSQVEYTAYHDKGRPSIAIAAVLVHRKVDQLYKYHMIYQVGQELRVAFLDAKMNIKHVCVKPTTKGSDGKTYDLALFINMLQGGFGPTLQ